MFVLCHVTDGHQYWLPLPPHFKRGHEHAQRGAQLESALRRLFILLLGGRMTDTSSSRRLLLVSCGVVLSLSAGCSRWIELMSVPSTDLDREIHTIAQHEQVPLILDRIHMTRNGAPHPSSRETEQRLL